MLLFVMFLIIRDFINMHGNCLVTKSDKLTFKRRAGSYAKSRLQNTNIIFGFT